MDKLGLTATDRITGIGPVGTFWLLLGVGLFAFWATCQFAASIEVPV